MPQALQRYHYWLKVSQTNACFFGYAFLFGNKKGLDFHQLDYLAAWHIYFGVCKRQGLIHRAVLIPDYYEFQRHEGGLQPSIWTEICFKGLASPFGVASH